MDSDTLMDRIEAVRSEADQDGAAAPEPSVKFLVVRVDQTRYALPADQVREIVVGAARHYIPFVPPYIRGLINRHGEPYAVFDLRVRFEKEALEAETLVISGSEGGRLAFLVSDIVEILKVPERRVRAISSDGEESACFAGALTVQDDEVLIIHIGNLLAELTRDLEAL
jgi:chemotaxis signal transduction protein